jgi:hypothetical protein
MIDWVIEELYSNGEWTIIAREHNEKLARKRMDDYAEEFPDAHFRIRGDKP